jgi:peptide/nickel transport system substrate-binding protein
MATGLALCACTSDRGVPRARTPVATAAPSTVPAGHGGTLTIAYPHEPATLNPFVVGGDAPATRDLTKLLLPGFYRFGPNGSRERWLLASEPRLDPGPPFRIAVRLREDAVWSDGSPITSADVRFTWKTILDRRWPIASRDGYDRITDVVAVDARRLSLVFSAPFSRWRDLFSAGLGVLPSHVLVGRNFGSTLEKSWPVSGGPFVLRAWTPGLRVVFARNPRAWGTAPSLDRLVVTFVGDSLTALRLLESGAVGALSAYQTADFGRRAAAISGTQVTSDIGATWAGVFLDVGASPLSDQVVRRALTLSIDARRIAVGLVRAEGTYLGAPPATARVPARLYLHNLARARSMLQNAGWRGAKVRSRRGVSLSLTIAGVDDLLSFLVMRALQLQAQRAGIRFELVSLTSPRLWGGWLRSNRMRAALVISRDPSAGFLRARFGTTGASNLSSLRDPTLQRLLAQADLGRSDAEAGAQRRLASLAAVIPLYRVRVSLAARGVEGMRASAGADGPFWNAERWSLRRPR